MNLNLPYHQALSPYCSAEQWLQESPSVRLLLLKKLGITDMNVLIQCILWPTDGKKILPLKWFHLEMINLFMACIRGEIPQREVLYLIPRFHLKTQLITTAGTVWQLLNDPEETVLVNSQHLDLATRIVGAAIRPIFTENALFRACYPEWCPPENQVRNWGTQSSLIMCNRVATNKTPSVLAGSFEAPKTGDHFGLIISDDPHNEKNVGTIDQIMKVIDGWKNLDYLDDGDRTKRVYAATRWHFADVNNEIMRELAPNFYQKFIDKTLLYNQPLANIELEDTCAVYLLGVWKDEAHSDVIWPEKQSKEKTLAWKAKHGAYKFGCQMENDPVPPEDRTFNPDNFRYYDIITELDFNGVPQRYYVCGEEKTGEDPDTGRPLMRYRKIPVNEVTNYMTVDPAYGDESYSDYNGIVVCGHWIEPKSRLRWLIVLDVVRQKLTTAQSKRKIEELYVKWDCKAVGIEANATQRNYVEQLQRDPRWGGELNINLVPIKRGQNRTKGERVTRLEPYYETYRIWHPRRMMNGVLEQELLAFVGSMSRGHSDDVADAMSDHVDFAHVRRMPDYDPLSGARHTPQPRERLSLQGRGRRNERDLWRVI